VRSPLQLSVSQTYHGIVEEHVVAIKVAVLNEKSVLHPIANDKGWLSGETSESIVHKVAILKGDRELRILTVGIEVI
jgi:hypothetical protein